MKLTVEKQNTIINRLEQSELRYKKLTFTKSRLNTVPKLLIQFNSIKADHVLIIPFSIGTSNKWEIVNKWLLFINYVIIIDFPCIQSSMKKFKIYFFKIRWKPI